MLRGLQGVEELIGESEKADSWYSQYHRWVALRLP